MKELESCFITMISEDLLLGRRIRLHCPTWQQYSSSTDGFCYNEKNWVAFPAPIQPFILKTTVIFD